jgi:segregation and condensation protein B
MVEESQCKAKIEGLLFVSGEPISLKRLAELLEMTEDAVKKIMEEMQAEMAKPDNGICLLKVAGGYQLGTKAELSATIEKLAQVSENRLSMAAMETLSIVAFRQPITKQEIEAIRGVKIDRVLNRLLDMGLVKEIGRKQVLGRPILYATTDEFLSCFGLDDLTDLPRLPEAEQFLDEVLRQADADFLENDLGEAKKD